MIKAVLMDMDNTLLKTQELYEEAHAELAALVNTFTATGYEHADVIATARRIEVSLFDTFGYGAAMLPQAFENTLLHYVPKASEAAIETAREIANNVYERVPGIKPGVQKGLQLLEPHFDLYLLTAGDAEVQQRRIDQMPFRHFFKDIFIVPEKNAQTYTALLGRLNLAPEEVVMIGDSLRSDIIPAVEAGLSASYVESINWHGREMNGLKLPETRAAAHDDFAEAAAAIVREARMPTPAPRQFFRPPAA
jgi:putative hydrolase of the HAD superfamily